MVAAIEKFAKISPMVLPIFPDCPDTGESARFSTPSPPVAES